MLRRQSDRARRPDQTLATGANERPDQTTDRTSCNGPRERSSVLLLSGLDRAARSRIRVQAAATSSGRWDERFVARLS